MLLVALILEHLIHYSGFVDEQVSGQRHRINTLAFHCILNPGIAVERQPVGGSDGFAFLELERLVSFQIRKTPWMLLDRISQKRTDQHLERRPCFIDHAFQQRMKRGVTVLSSGKRSHLFGVGGRFFEMPSADSSNPARS